MKTRFYCKQCKSVRSDVEVVKSSQTGDMHCRKCGHTVVNYNFSDDKTKYATSYPERVALLQCFGAEIVERDTSNPNGIIFVLRHERIVEYVNAIFNGTLDRYEGQLKIQDYMRFYEEVMKFIKETKINVMHQQGGRDGRKN